MRILFKSAAEPGLQKAQAQAEKPVAVVPSARTTGAKRPATPRAPRKGQAKCEHPEEAQQNLWAAGGNGLRYPVRVCGKCGRMALTPPDFEVFKKAFYAAPPARRLPLRMLMKAVASGCFANPASCDLRWITLHPNGEGTEGVPALVHDNGQEYTVVGGAGHKLDHMVLPKTGKKTTRKKEKVEKPKMAPDSPEVAKLRETQKTLRAEAQAKQEGLVARVLEKLNQTGGAFQGDVMASIEGEARKRALKEKKDASPAEQQEFADRAAKEAKDEAASAANKVMADVMNEAARQQMGDADPNRPLSLTASLSGRKLAHLFAKGDIDELVRATADIASMRAQAHAIGRALAMPTERLVSALNLKFTPLTQEEADAQNVSRYIDEDRVDKNVALIKGSEGAGLRSQQLNQTAGAADGVNNFVAGAAGHAILSPDKVRAIGIENACRVAAAYLTSSGQDAKATAAQLQKRIVETGYASAAAVLSKCGDMDAVTENAKAAAAANDGSLTRAQASIIAANMAVNKYKLLNVARGQLRAASTLSFLLEHGSGDQPMILPAGGTAVGASAFAKGLGLGDDDFAVLEPGAGAGGGYRVSVPADRIQALARSHSLDEANRNADMDDLRHDVDVHAGQWHAQGFNNDHVLLRPHQELAARAIVDQKRMVLNYGPGSGKTPVLYAAAGQLLSSGKCDRGLITMPSKPRAQQDDYYDVDAPDAQGNPTLKTGERKKFLSAELADKVLVVESGEHLRRVLPSVGKPGGPAVLIVSPDLMRDNVEALKAAGFGGEKSFTFLDEAHEFAIGQKEGAGSQRARAAREMAKAEYAVAASGTLVETDGSELHSVYDMIHPGALGPQKQFAQEWTRLAQGGQNFFAGEAMRSMRDRLSGGMLTYQKGVTGDDGEPVQLAQNVVTVPTAPEQKAAIARHQQQYDKDRLSPDPNVRDSASLALYGRVMRVLNNGVKGSDGKVVNPKLGALAKIMEDEKARDPHNRVAVYSDELAPLRAAEETLRGHKMKRVTGAEGDQQVREACSAMNNRDNDTDGILLSRAGNYGLNLQGGDHMVKMHAMLTPSREKQVDARIFRHGQVRNVRATTILTDHPFEQMAQFRNRRIKAPEMDLLSALSEDNA